MAIPEKNGMLSLFDLRLEVLLMASATNLYFQREPSLKTKEHYQWEYRWIDLQGISIGGGWVAACNKE